MISSSGSGSSSGSSGGAYPRRLSGNTAAVLVAEKLIPGRVLRHIQSLPGNDRCCGCHSGDTAWASVNHGILLCITCAGAHRSLGVGTSFVRSLHMDTWSEAQLESLRQGGNAQLRDYFTGLRVWGGTCVCLCVWVGGGGNVRKMCPAAAPRA